MRVDVSYPDNPSHAQHWHGHLNPLIEQIQLGGVKVRITSHPDTGHPHDTMAFVALWMPGHAPGKATRDGLGTTGLQILEEIVAEMN
jgi:hypothetical protein